MAERRKVVLERGVGLGAIAMVVLGNVSMAVFVALGVIAQSALAATPLVFAGIGVVVLLVLLSYLEGIAMLPQAGGAAGFARRGFGELASFFVGWALLLDYMILVILCAFFAVHYIGSMPGLEPLLASPADGYMTGGFIVVVAFLALRGMRTRMRIRLLVSGVAVLALILLAAVGSLLVLDAGAVARSIDVGSVPSWSGLLFAAPLVMLGFTGLDTVANLGAELEHPGRDVPRPLIWSTVLSVILFSAISLVALSAQPVQGSAGGAFTALGEERGWVDRPVIGIIDGLGLDGVADTALRYAFGGLAAAVLLLVAGSAISGMSRATYFMAEHRQAPSILASVDPRTGVPRRGLVILTVVALLLLGATITVADSALALAQLYAFGATFSASLAGLSIVRLRWLAPDLDRPFRAPWEVRWRGRRISVPMVAGTAGAIVLWLLVLATHPEARVLGVAWMVLGFVAYGTYRLTHGLPFARLATARVAAQVRIDAARYRRILIAIRPQAGRSYDAVDAELVGLAHKLLDVEEHEARVRVIFVHEVPLVEPLDAPLGDVERETNSRMESIVDAAGKVDLELSGAMLRARAAGRMICQEAAQHDADVVLLVAASRRARPDGILGRAASYVLRHAPCDVVMLSMPAQLGDLAADAVAASVSTK